jgi:hypothetical protein
VLAGCRCECCGWQGLDEVAQFCIEEAAAAAVVAQDNKAHVTAEHGSEAAARHAELMAQATGGKHNEG